MNAEARAPCGGPGTRPGAAAVANLIIPGAGQWLRGRRPAGAVFAGLFILAVVAFLATFVHGYASYLIGVTSGDLLETGAIENLAAAIHLSALLWLLGAALLVVVAAEIDLLREVRASRRNGNTPHRITKV